jgi:hypothetical protein
VSRKLLAGFLAMLAMSAVSLSAPITYTVYGHVIPTVLNPFDSGPLVGHVTFEDGGATGSASIYWPGEPKPEDFTFRMLASIPGPPDQRIYNGASGDNTMLFVDWEGGSSGIFSSSGWDSTSGVNGWDVWTISAHILPDSIIARTATITESVEGAIPINEPAAAGMALLGFLGLFGLRQLVV